MTELPPENTVDEHIDGPPVEKPIVETPRFLHDVLLYAARLSAGLLCQAGAISIDEARMMSALKPFSEGQRGRILQMLQWCKATGVVLPVAVFDLWYEVDNQ